MKMDGIIAESARFKIINVFVLPETQASEARVLFREQNISFANENLLHKCN